MVTVSSPPSQKRAKKSLANREKHELATGPIDEFDFDLDLLHPSIVHSHNKIRTGRIVKQVNRTIF